MTAVLRLLVAMAAALLVVSLSIFVLGDRSVLASPPEAVSEGFIRELVGRRYERALPYLDEELRQRITADTLRAYRARAPWSAMELIDVRGEPGTIRGDTARASVVMIDARGRSMRTRLLLAWSKGVWEIARLDQPAAEEVQRSEQ